MARAASLSVTNDAEDRRLRQVYNRTADVVLRSEVAIPALVTRVPEQNRALWLGNLSYRSNLGGLREFLRSDWFLFREAGWSLSIVGSGASSAIEQELQQWDGVEVRGFVEDLAPEFSRATLGVVPLWSGGGTKIKTLTMMAHGLPVAATEAGAEGIPRTFNGLPTMFSAAEPGSFFPVINRKEPAEIDEVGVNGRALVSEHFSGSAIAGQVDELLRQALKK